MSKYFAWAVAAAMCVALMVSPNIASAKEKKAKAKTPTEKAEAAFKKLDTNKDGNVSLDEFKAAAEKKAEKAKAKKAKK